MLNSMQEIMLRVMLGPEDPTAWARYKKQMDEKRRYPRHRTKILTRVKARYSANREQIRASKKAKYHASPDSVREESRLWRLRNPEKSRKLTKEWYVKNPEARLKYRQENAVELRAARRKRHIKRWESDINYRLRFSLSARVRKVLAGVSKSAKTLSLLGCSVPELRIHLESLFVPGMDWANYGQWHIDHKRPCASFDLSDPAQQRECFHYTNLQPLWAGDNIRKGDKWVGV